MYNRFYTIQYSFSEFDMGNRLNMNNLNPWIDINPNRRPLTVTLTYLGLNRKGDAEFAVSGTRSWNRVTAFLEKTNDDSSYGYIYTGSTYNNRGGAYVEFPDPRVAEQMGVQVFSSSGSRGNGGFGQFGFAESRENRNAITLYPNTTAFEIFNTVGGTWAPGLERGSQVTANLWLPGPRLGETIQRLDIPGANGSSAALLIKDSQGRITEIDASYLASNVNQVKTANDRFLTFLDVSEMQPVQLGWTSFGGNDWGDGQEFRIWV